MRGVTVLFVGLGALWLIQFALTWLQARAFLRETRALRSAGRVATGMGRRRPMRRAYVTLAADDTGRLVAARVLTGYTVFARPRALSALVGLTVAEVATVPTGPGLPAPVLTAARQAAGFLTRTTPAPRT